MTPKMDPGGLLKRVRGPVVRSWAALGDRLGPKSAPRGLPPMYLFRWAPLKKLVARPGVALGAAAVFSVYWSRFSISVWRFRCESEAEKYENSLAGLVFSCHALISYIGIQEATPDQVMAQTRTRNNSKTQRVNHCQPCRNDTFLMPKWLPKPIPDPSKSATDRGPATPQGREPPKVTPGGPQGARNEK